jgi:hypothetical protein
MVLEEASVALRSMHLSFPYNNLNLIVRPCAGLSSDSVDLAVSLEIG